jgi:1-acyl-sn-glycerol-3-phosphate acyltransferase
VTLYSLLDYLLGVIFRLLFNMRVIGRENLPASGGAIIAANHISLLDPPVLGVAASPRVLHFMAKKELFANQLFAWLIAKLHAFPVNRGAPDRVAIRKAMSLLERGEFVAIFPEGTRSKTGILGQPEPGVALIAAKTGSPIVPVAVLGTNKVRFGLEQPSFSVAFGRPVIPEPGKTDRESLEKLNASVMTAIAELLEKLQTPEVMRNYTNLTN